MRYLYSISDRLFILLGYAFTSVGLSASASVCIFYMGGFVRTWFYDHSLDSVWDVIQVRVWCFCKAFCSSAVSYGSSSFFCYRGRHSLSCAWTLLTRSWW